MYILSVFFILIALAVSPLDENENQNVDLDLLLEKAAEAANNSEFNDALFYLDEILKHDPDNSSVLNNKGGILLKLEKYDESLQYFEKAIEINPYLVEAINNKAIALVNLDRHVDSLTTFYDAYMIDPYNLITLENMAVIVEAVPFVIEFGYAKIELRNSDDQLVGYTESHDIIVQYPLAKLYLEDKVEWKPIEINGEGFEVLEYSDTFSIAKPGIYSRTDLILQKDDAPGVKIVEVLHDGFLIKPGDKATIKIILLRPS